MDTNPIFSYTRRDYEGSRRESIQKIPVISKGAWTDLNSSDPGIIILDYVHALVDMMNYYQDHQALESFLSTAKERANIFRLAKQLSYKIRSAKGATCNVEFTTHSPRDYIVRIPKYTSLSTASGINYLTSEDAYLSANDTRVSVPCTQGTLHTLAYQGTGVSRFSAVEDAKNQTIRIADANVDIDSIVILDDQNRLWERVDYIAYTTELDRAYQIDLNPDNTITIKFGDGLRGVVPATTDYLNVVYISTDAEAGSTGANTIIVLNDDIIDDKGKYVDFDVNNNIASLGGSSIQSSYDIKEQAPGVIKSQYRAVTLDDYAALAKEVDGVADAKAYDINTNPDICTYNEVKVLVLPKNPDDPIEELNSRVYNYLRKLMVSSVSLYIISPMYISIDLTLQVKQRENAEGGLEYTIQRAVESYFNSRSLELGMPFNPYELTAELSKLYDVKAVIPITPNTQVDINSLSIARLGKLTIDMI